MKTVKLAGKLIQQFSRQKTKRALLLWNQESLELHV